MLIIIKCLEAGTQEGIVCPVNLSQPAEGRFSRAAEGTGGINLIDNSFKYCQVQEGTTFTRLRLQPQMPGFPRKPYLSR